ncbi:hypothetical protein EXIGLDRAFT_830352 [Exidia glandulosa HHB12029]|uniref:Transcriptional repressor Tup1 N-terminal domain-containing protein n=1 Tax=Exidia glandulosa HHB12029 TaxID=1314781 RepID=A0A165NLA7_EXIGL|nr:hypothetical protein EXIGLDRAFT_830352 [Exidia glandulosa HHB12029]
MHSSRGQYQHRQLSPPPGEPAGKRLMDALHAVRAMFDGALEENRQLRQSNSSYDSKVRRYLQELDSVCTELRALEARHRRERDVYEAEVRRLREEIDAVRHPPNRDREREREPYAQPPPPLPTQTAQHPQSPAMPPQASQYQRERERDRDRDRDRDRTEREKPRSSASTTQLRPATFTPEPGTS